MSTNDQIDRRAQLESMLTFATAELARLGPPPPPLPSSTPTPQYASVSAFAELVDVSEKTVRRMILEGMPHARPRRRTIRIPVATALVWMAGQRTVPVDAKASATAHAHKGSLQ